jgi:predicted transcriptional regulator
MTKKRKEESSHSKQDILFSILLYLYNKPGRSPTDIQLFCSDTTQAYDVIAEYLEELRKVGAVEEIKISKYRIIFKITDKGKKIVELSKTLLDVYFTSVDVDSERFNK